MFLRGYVLLCAVVAALALAASTLTAQPKPSAAVPGAAGQTVEPAIAKLLAGIRAADKGQLAVSEEDGQFLRLLVGATNARSVLEIGGASGYSAIWIGMGLRQTGGRLVTIEYDPMRAKELAANIQKAGLSDIVRVVAGDAFKRFRKSLATSISCFSTRGSPTTRSSSRWCFRASTRAGCSSRTT